MTSKETLGHSAEVCQSSLIRHAERGRRIADIRRSHSQANAILLHIALSGWRSAAEFWNTQLIPRYGEPLDFLNLESEL